MEQEIKKLIDQKKKGVDCTEAESAQIKGFLKEFIPLPQSGDIQLIEEIQEFFPLEYGEAIDEMNDGINKKPKTLYRTKIVVEVLSENEIGDVDLQTIINNTDMGDWSGKNITIEQDMPLTGKYAVNAIESHGTDVEFFGMDEEGNDWDY